MKNGRIARRTLLGRAGLAIGGGLASGLASGLAPVGAEIAVARAGAPADLWGENYWAQKGDAKLAVYRKFPALKPRSGERKVRARLVPGAWIVAVLSLSSYDLDVPPGSEYSMMDVFAQAGLDVWTTDHEAMAVRHGPRAMPTSPAASRT